MQPPQTGGRTRDGAGWKMFQSRRVILKGRIQIGLGQVPGITRFRKETQIREPQFLDCCRQMLEMILICLPMYRGMNKHQPAKQHHGGKQD